jgi:hypothetical protein
MTSPPKNRRFKFSPFFAAIAARRFLDPADRVGNDRPATDADQVFETDPSTHLNRILNDTFADGVVLSLYNHQEGRAFLPMAKAKGFARAVR